MSLRHRIPRLVIAAVIGHALQAADAQSLALADGVIHQALMLPEQAIGIEIADVARRDRQIALQEFAERPLADEADAGRILLRGVRQAGIDRYAAHLALGQMTNRKQRARQLRLVQPVEEVALVLGAVLSLEQFEAAVEFAHLRIVAGGDAPGTESDGVIEEGAELDFRIAQHVRIGRAPGLVLAQEAREHALLVLGREIDDFEVHADDVCRRHRVDQVLPGRTVFVGVVVFPVLHEQADDLVAGPLEQQRRHRRIDAAGHAHHHGFTRLNR
jgi:hypothetical protein